MHNAVNVALILGAHRNDIAPLTLGDQGILQIGLDIAALHQAIQGGQQAILGDAQFTAYPG